MKTDARIRYTKRVIEDTFLGLLETKAITKITVKELCELCEINRATFYNHYEDMFDLLKQIEDSILNDIYRLVSLDNYCSMDDFYLEVLTFIKSNNKRFLIICSEKGNPLFTQQLFLKCY